MSSTSNPYSAATPCTLTGASNCVPAAMAANDLNQWAGAVGNVLPGYLATITCSQAKFLPVTCTIQLQWTENGVAVSAQDADELPGADLISYTCSHEPPTFSAASSCGARLHLCRDHGRHCAGTVPHRRSAHLGAGDAPHGHESIGACRQLQATERMAMQLITDVVQFGTGLLHQSADAAPARRFWSGLTDRPLSPRRRRSW